MQTVSYEMSNPTFFFIFFFKIRKILISSAELAHWVVKVNFDGKEKKTYWSNLQYLP